MVDAVAVETLAIPGLKLLLPRRYSDHLGFFSETFRLDQFSRNIDAVSFVQDNHSYSAKPGTVRGLHFQSAPSAQGKLGQHVSVVLSAENWRQLYVPIGFAHGFCTLEPDTDVIYKVTAPYDPATDKGLAWDDPALGIDWPVSHSDAVISDKDKTHPCLDALPAWFT